MKKKILYVATALKGGEWRHIQDLQQKLESDFDITVISTSNYNKTNHIPIFTLTPTGICRLWHFIRKNRFSLIHCHGYKSLTAIRIIKCIYPKCPPIIGTVHGFFLNFFPNKLKRWVRLKLEQHMARIQDWSIFVSQSDQHNAIQHHCATLTTSSIITNGVEMPKPLTTSISTLLEPYTTLQPNTFICLFCASLEQRKGPELLIQSLYHLKKEGRLDSIICCLLGEGPLEKQLQKQIKDHQLERHVFLCGQQDNVIEWMQTANLLVLPSEHEGLPYTLLEAMSVRCPIITTNVPGCRDLIQDKETGRLVPSGNVIALANAIYDMHCQPKKRKTYAENAQKSQQSNYTLEKMASDTKRIYHRFLS